MKFLIIIFKIIKLGFSKNNKILKNKIKKLKKY